MSRRTKRPGQSTARGFALLVLGIVALLVVAGWIIGVTRRDQSLLAFIPVALVVGLVGTVVQMAGNAAMRRGRRHMARPAGSSHGEAVLYLRAFRHDAAAGRPIRPTDPQAFSLERTEEEVLKAAFRHVGNLQAIGDPEERLPTLGAQRWYPDDQWRSEALSRMSSARLVVIYPDSTPGLLWEAEAVVEHVRPEKLLIIVPSHDPTYAGFRQAAGAFFPRGLPECPDNPANRIGRGFIGFGADWTPRVGLFGPPADATGTHLATVVAEALDSVIGPVEVPHRSSRAGRWWAGVWFSRRGRMARTYGLPIVAVVYLVWLKLFG